MGFLLYQVAFTLNNCKYNMLVEIPNGKYWIDEILTFHVNTA
jgi:hypothetical protein